MAGVGRGERAAHGLVRQLAVAGGLIAAGVLLLAVRCCANGLGTSSSGAARQLLRRVMRCALSGGAVQVACGVPPPVCTHKTRNPRIMEYQ